MKLKFYEYEKCSICVKARKWLESKEVTFVRIPIREHPPSKEELAQLLNAHEGNLKKLFNTSGRDYRDPKIKETLANLSKEETLDFLSTRGNLIKRPVLIGRGIARQGFKPEDWGEIPQL